MSLSAWITNIIVAAVLYGGLGLCISVAVRKGREEHKKHPESWTESNQD
ncbi:MAG: hypothetical protein JXB46_09945 [Candidatus Eisenbacteria bacterium]|nr:hypothetical protein [Candidatus Eisenbacteria bacterium]